MCAAPNTATAPRVRPVFFAISGTHRGPFGPAALHPQIMTNDPYFVTRVVAHHSRVCACRIFRLGVARGVHL